jgi:hypothetical protein
LVGNKIDRNDDRVVSSEEGRALANSWKVPFVEISAMDIKVLLNKNFLFEIFRFFRVFKKSSKKVSKQWIISIHLKVKSSNLPVYPMVQ